MSSRIALTGAVVMTSLALLAGCGGSSSSSTGTSSSAGTASQGGQAAGKVPDQPCSLVTKAEAEAIMGVSISDPVGDICGQCSYNAVEGVPGQTKVAFFANGTALYDRIKGNQPAVSGVGDAAVCDAAAGNLTTVVKAKDLVVGVVSTDCDKAKAFALKILSRL